MYSADGIGEVAESRVRLDICECMCHNKHILVDEQINVYLLKNSLQETHAIAQAVRQYLPTAQPWIQGLVASCEIFDGQNITRAGYF
jgi:hypothetical protein